MFFLLSRKWEFLRWNGKFTDIVLTLGVAQDPSFQDKVSLKKGKQCPELMSQRNGVGEWEGGGFWPCAILSVATSSSWGGIPHRVQEHSCPEDSPLRPGPLPAGRRSLPSLWLAEVGNASWIKAALNSHLFWVETLTCREWGDDRVLLLWEWGGFHVGEVFSRPLASDWLRLSGDSISGCICTTLSSVVAGCQ